MNFESNLIEMVNSRLQLERRSNDGSLPDGKIEEVLQLTYENLKSLKNDDEIINLDSILRDLRSKYTTTISEEGSSLSENHEPWLTEEITDQWKFFKRYKDTLNKKKSISEIAIDRMDSSTDKILDFLCDPNKPGPWDKRGLVKGYVQSGKTMSYSGLINKALDVGYKFIIVLSGRANDLRTQTQMRIDEDVIGLDSEKRLINKRVVIGVGNHSDPDLRDLRVNTATTVMNDFNRRQAINLGLTDPGPGFILVIKKNVTILRNVLNFLQQNWTDQNSEIIVEASERNDDTEIKSIDLCPVLLIDDEADDSSIDTKAGVTNEADEIDPEHDPTRTNSYIRRILLSFSRSCYVGYTATPYANVFIHHRGESHEDGEDLFPRDFIVSLPKPDNYIGSSKLFPLVYDPDHKSQITEICDNIDSQDDERKGWMPPRHRTSHHPRYKESFDDIPPSLKEAIQSFLIAAAGAQIRKKDSLIHNTMLINVSTWVNVHTIIRRQVEEYVMLLKRSLKNDSEFQNDSILYQIKILWEKEFILKLDNKNETLYESLNWEKLYNELLDVANKLEVMQLSGDSNDVLDYKNNSDKGLNVIAIGGHKLSRGLTLEGLSVSYFLRSPNIAVHDSIMQMGRWFGYRPGYDDLCRMYMNNQMQERFADFAEAEEEFTQELITMEKLKRTPRDFGLSIEQNGTWMITARNKSRAAESINLNFNDRVKQTRIIAIDEKSINDNWNNLNSIIEKLDSDYSKNYEKKSGDLIWKNIPPDLVLQFLSNYKDSRRSRVVRGQFLNIYISHRNEFNELMNWTIVVKGLDNEGKEVIINDHKIRMSTRTASKINRDGCDIGAAQSGSDVRIGLEKNEERNGQSGILIIVPIQVKSESETEKYIEELSFVGFAVQCGRSNDPNPGKVVLANTIAQELLYEEE